MRNPTILITLLCCVHMSWAQNDTPGWPSGKHPEHWEQVQDSVIKQEVAQFNHKGAQKGSTQATAGGRLQPIPLKRCNDTFAYFDKGTIYALEVLVHIFLPAERLISG
ncbi:hypothetical protein D3H65_11755 [Paraflavitalea soli]|uniref:Uncharacterized protein n=1 Tax=Paraflavitalea soli TaxID=2315862 RepID=A0A3B7MJI4_9BACT|nr:hypothetical protein [Paraflavitalea soli]AXY74614.1 hypothetical protein D3H65_11755 [Paraflavitalea soli]